MPPQDSFRGSFQEPNQRSKLITFILAMSCLALIPDLMAAPEINSSGKQTVNPAFKNGKVIKNFPSISNKGLSYQLFLPSCTSSPCQIEVQLLSKQTIQDRQSLAWPADTQDIFTEQVGKWYGLGDPMDNNNQYTAWTIGSEYEGVSVTAQMVKLGKNTDALLVVQTGGYEHIRRYHSLYTAQGQKLVKAWEQKEAQGPTWATANPFPLSHSAHSKTQNRIHDIMYFTATRSSATGGDFFDELKVNKLHWDSTTSRLKISDTPMPRLFYIVTYPFESQDSANQLLYKYRNCLDDSTLVLNGKTMFPATQSTVVLGAVTQNRQFADNSLKKIKQCLPDKKVKIFTF